MSAIQTQKGLHSLPRFNSSKPVEELQKEKGWAEILRLSSNENQIGPSPKAIAALRQSLELINFYPDTASVNLCEALAKKYRVNPEQVTIGNGADGIIASLCHAYLDDASEAIVGQSSFPVYDVDIKMLRAGLVKVPRKDYGLDLDGMASAITPKTRLIFVCNPNNPTGTILRKREIASFISRVPQNVLIVIDEAYFEFVDDPEFPDTFQYINQNQPNIILLRTFSKAYGLAGLRVGYGIGHPDIIHAINQVKGTFPVNLLAQIAALAALEDNSFVEKVAQENKENREFLYREFDRLDLEYVPTQTNFILTRIGKNTSGIATKLAESGIFVRPTTGSDLPEHMRITIGRRDQNEKLIRALKKHLEQI